MKLLSTFVLLSGLLAAGPAAAHALVYDTGDVRVIYNTHAYHDDYRVRHHDQHVHHHHTRSHRHAYTHWRHVHHPGCGHWHGRHGHHYR